MVQENLRIKKDRYCKSRGGFAYFLHILCAGCTTEVLVYQKDGCGYLHRMYVDRITAPKELVEEQKKITQKSEMKGLFCPACGQLLATPMVYAKENRLAYNVIDGKIIKRKIG